MGTAAILLNGTELFEQIVNILSIESPMWTTCMWNLVKTIQTVSEKKTFKDFTILYMYTVQIWPCWKRSMVNLRPPFNKHSRPWVPDATYKDSTSKRSWFWRTRFLSLFTTYGHSSHLVQWRGTIQTYCQYPFNREIILFLQSKFQLKSTKGLGRDVKNWFSRWQLRWPSWIFNQLSFSYFVSTRNPDAPHPVSIQLEHSL